MVPKSLLWRKLGLYMVPTAALVWLVIFASSTRSQRPLAEAVRQCESARQGDNCIGDRGLKNKAYGPMQIRQPCLDDVNRLYARGIKKKFGKAELTLADVKGNRTLSVWVFEKYLEHYATRERLGREPTDEDRARIWNGGPNGWKKASTRKYGQKVKSKLR